MRTPTDTPINLHRGGMTLIEIMIVVTLIAAMMTIAAVSFGVIGQADVSGGSLKFSAAVRYSFNMAATSNMTLQMKIDFDEGTYTVERLDVSGGLSVEELGGTTMKSSALAGRADRSRAGRMDDEDSKFGVVTRTPVEGAVLGADEARLEDGVYFVGLMTSHHDEVQTEGVGTINFFSNGFVERSVVYIGDEAARRGDEGGIVYTVSINPLTGQSSVRPGRTEVSASFFAEEEDR